MSDGGFEIRDIHHGDYLVFPNVRNLRANSPIYFRAARGDIKDAVVEVRANGVKGKLLGTCRLPYTGGWQVYRTLERRLTNAQGTADLCLVFRGGEGELLRPNWLSFVTGKHSS